MKFGRLLAGMAMMGRALAAKVHAARGEPPPFQGPLLDIRIGGGVHRRVAPNPTGALRIQRAAAKRRNQARHRAHCKGRR